MTREDELVRQAFNEGCDARLAGQPITTNPYKATCDPSLKRSWYKGWRDVQWNWGVDAGKHPVTPLPPIRHAEAL